MLRLYEILYLPKQQRKGGKPFVRKDHRYKYIKELTGLKSYGKAFRVLQQPEVSNPIEKEVIPSLISKYFPDGGAKEIMEEEVSNKAEEEKVEYINSYDRFDDVCTIEEEASNKVDRMKSTTITELDVELALKRVNLASATGVDSWTYSLIKSLWFSKSNIKSYLGTLYSSTDD